MALLVRYSSGATMSYHLVRDPSANLRILLIGLHQTAYSPWEVSILRYHPEIDGLTQRTGIPCHV